jgi:hypothetical protein
MDADSRINGFCKKCVKHEPAGIGSTPVGCNLGLMVGCSHPSKRLTAEMTKSLTIGDSRDQVEKVLGAPASKRKHPQFEELEIWYYSETDFVTLESGGLIRLTIDNQQLPIAKGTKAK